MTSSAYEHILQELARLTPDERRQLRQALDDELPGARFVSAHELRLILARPPQPLTEREQAAARLALERIQQAATHIGAWPDTGPQVEGWQKEFHACRNSSR